jgi:hypothetical protein
MWSRLKHAVLDRAHPLPESVEVYAGRPGTLSYAIARAVISRMSFDAMSERAKLLERGQQGETTGGVGEEESGDEEGESGDEEGESGDEEGDESLDRPSVRVDEGDEVEGLFPVCRYLGRLWRTHPVDPFHALLVDGSLDRLARAMHVSELAEPSDLPKVVARVARELERRLARHDDLWMEGMDEPSLADACWKGYFTWARTQDAWKTLPPRVAAWWHAMR